MTISLLELNNFYQIHYQGKETDILHIPLRRQTHPAVQQDPTLYRILFFAIVYPTILFLCNIISFVSLLKGHIYILKF